MCTIYTENECDSPNKAIPYNGTLANTLNIHHFDIVSFYLFQVVENVMKQLNEKLNCIYERESERESYYPSPQKKLIAKK